MSTQDPSALLNSFTQWLEEVQPADFQPPPLTPWEAASEFERHLFTHLVQTVEGLLGLGHGAACVHAMVMSVLHQAEANGWPAHHHGEEGQH